MKKSVTQIFHPRIGKLSKRDGPSLGISMVLATSELTRTRMRHMLQCNSLPIQLTPARRRQLVSDCKGGRRTSDTGVLLLREVDRGIGLIGAINDCLPDPRDPQHIVQRQREMLAQRIFSLPWDMEDLNDQQTMRDDSDFR